MKVSEIRSKFIQFFKNHGHQEVESSSLVPHNDPTLLFTNAGMNQFKDVFTGKEKRSYTRATTSQKCVRAGGKHNDLENVGFTARHHTFFEMLGNFSFGDYFKKEAINLAWKFVTEELKIPKDRLYVSVFNDDDEAAEIWEKEQGVPAERIFRFGEKDNFWSMGDTGPCGPCSEIFYDRQGGAEKVTAKMVEADGDRFMEFWNLVFMQYNRSEDGSMTPLPRPSVDTGAGLERLGSILQNTTSNYETDCFQDIIQKTEDLCGIKYDLTKNTHVSFRVIADHSRAAAFLIADGVMPSNEGRGYVLRRIMRRAIRHGKKLGLEKPFFDKTVGFVIDQMKDAYPDLEEKRTFILKVVQAEEEQFRKTLAKGLQLLEDEVKKLKKGSLFPGEAAFKLYDTYGFPLDLTQVITQEHGIEVDLREFEKSMSAQKEESRKHWKGSGDAAVSQVFHEVLENLKSKNQIPTFVGYTETEVPGVCVALLKSEDNKLKKVSEISSKDGTSIFAVFTPTPFYGESGGQTGDQGTVTTQAFEGLVIDVQKPLSELIVCEIKVKKGTLKVGESVHQKTNLKIRKLTEANHTATHLLHWALRETLGKHVKQAGSLVEPGFLRFDFSHFEAMTPEQLIKVEDLINQKIWEDFTVSQEEMSKDQATEKGAIAFFGEKYGESVRVISVGDFSVELCGGTHVKRSGDIHLFKIGSESGIAAGVRRIIAYTSEGAFQYLRHQESTLQLLKKSVKATSIDEIGQKIEKLFENEKELKKQIEKFQSQSAGHEVESLINNGNQLGEHLIVVGECTSDPSGIKRMREISDRIKQKKPQSIIVLGMNQKESQKAFLLASVGPKSNVGVKANAIIKEIAPFVDGKGGGKPDLAQAGGTKPTGLSEALQQASAFIQNQLG